MEKRQPVGAIPIFNDIATLRQNWGWFLFLGIVLVLLGCVAIGSAVAVTVFSVFLFGLILIGAGVVKFVQGVWAREWSGVFVSVLLAVLYVVVGGLCIARPAVSAVSLTFLIAAFCLVAGLFRMLASAIARFNHWGWVFFNGFVTFILGFLILSDWPVSGLWVIGLFIGIDLILSGWSWIILSLGARQT